MFFLFLGVDASNKDENAERNLAKLKYGLGSSCCTTPDLKSNQFNSPKLSPKPSPTPLCMITTDAISGPANQEFAPAYSSLSSNNYYHHDNHYRAVGTPDQTSLQISSASRSRKYSPHSSEVANTNSSSEHRQTKSNLSSSESHRKPARPTYLPIKKHARPNASSPSTRLHNHHSSPRDITTSSSSTSRHTSSSPSKTVDSPTSPYSPGAVLMLIKCFTLGIMVLHVH